MAPSTVDDGGRKLTKNEKLRLKAKEKKAAEKKASLLKPLLNIQTIKTDAFSKPASIEVELVTEDIDAVKGGKVVIDDSSLNDLKSVFEKFAKAQEINASSSASKRKDKQLGANGELMFYGDGEEDSDGMDEGGDDDDMDEGGDDVKLSNRQKKKLNRMTVAQLKNSVARPEVVEAHDVNSEDPRTLVYLKSYRNSVPVPRHWAQKKKFLSSKRGADKIPYELPEFIADTGIDKIRKSIEEQEEAKSSKRKGRDKVRPAMGKIDIDYQVLHDAFFKFQTKPKLTAHGELYYEGKEHEIDTKGRKPGPLSAELLEALGMEDNTSTPPPWLVNMQRYGPPPSYPHHRIPGLTAPLPVGQQFGYHAGGWGKPPVDQYGRPLYGDVFGTQDETAEEGEEAVDVGTHWGAMEPPLSEDEDEEGDDSDDSDNEEQGQNADKQKLGLGLGDTDTGTSVPGGDILGDAAAAAAASASEAAMTEEELQAAAEGAIDLRKRGAGGDVEDDGPKELYKVLEQKQGVTEGGLFASSRTYALDAGSSEEAGTGLGDSQEADLADMGEEGEGGGISVIAKDVTGTGGNEGEKKVKKKRSRVESGGGALAKKAKEFKF